MNKNVGINKLNGLRRKPTPKINENEKPSKIAANEIMYSRYTPKLSEIKIERARPHEDLAIDQFNVDKIKNDNFKLRELKEEIATLQKKLQDRDRAIREKDKFIESLMLKCSKLEDDNRNIKAKYFKKNTNSSNENEDKELALALEKINQMEKKNSRKNQPFENIIEQDDIINVPSRQDQFFGEFFSRHLPLSNFINVVEVDPLEEYDKYIMNEVCPNPDSMTYEQLIELGEKVGHVDKGFHKFEIEKIPTIKYSKTLYKNIDKCSVCQYDYEQSEILRKLNCGHIYHKPCIDEWLIQDKKCPVCKIEVYIK